MCCRSRRREDTWLTEGLPELRPSGLMGPAPLPAGPIYFLQYQGPPALSRGPDGKWQNKSPIFCMTVSTAAHFNLSLGVLGPAVKMKDEKGGKGPALLSYLSQIPNGSLVIFYDAQDVFVLRDTAAILEVSGGGHWGAVVLRHRVGGFSGGVQGGGGVGHPPPPKGQSDTGGPRGLVPPQGPRQGHRTRMQATRTLAVSPRLEVSVYRKAKTATNFWKVFRTAFYQICILCTEGVPHPIFSFRAMMLLLCIAGPRAQI